MIETVVFDLDDTLYDEIDYCRSAFSAVAAHLAESHPHLSADHVFRALWDPFAGGNHTRTFNSALETLNIPYDSEFIGALVEVYRKHTPSITLPPESLEVLNILKDRYKLAMLTDGFLPAQQLKVRALGIEHFFQCIVYTEALGRAFWKPSPVGFQKIAADLGTAPERMVYIGDNEEKDFVAPNALGFLTVRIQRPDAIHTKSAADPSARAQRRIESLSELPDLLSCIP